MNARAHRGLDRIEAAVRNGEYSLTYGLASAFSLGRAVEHEPDTGPIPITRRGCGCNCCDACKHGSTPPEPKPRTLWQSIRNALGIYDG